MYCVVDIETTGTTPGVHSILELGAVKLVGPGMPKTPHGPSFQRAFRLPANAVIDPEAMEVNKIDLLTHNNSATSSRRAMSAFCQWAKGCTIVGHNVAFDLGFLNVERGRLGLGESWYRRYDDTSVLARALGLPLSLGALCDHFGVPRGGHRALADARATAEVYRHLILLRDRKNAGHSQAT